MDIIYIARWTKRPSKIRRRKYLKIGFTKNLTTRLKGNSSSFKPADEVEIIAIYKVYNGRTIETLIHNRLKDYKADFGTEWFHINPKSALHKIEVCICHESRKYREKHGLECLGMDPSDLIIKEKRTTKVIVGEKCLRVKRN